MNKDLSSPVLLKFKGFLFLLLGLIAGILLLFEAGVFTTGNPKIILLFFVSIWAFARFYYFALYVLEHYADPKFRYAGLLDLAIYLLTGKQTGSPKNPS